MVQGEVHLLRHTALMIREEGQHGLRPKGLAFTCLVRDIEDQLSLPTPPHRRIHDRSVRYRLVPTCMSYSPPPSRLPVTLTLRCRHGRQDEEAPHYCDQAWYNHRPSTTLPAAVVLTALQAPPPSSTSGPTSPFFPPYPPSSRPQLASAMMDTALSYALQEPLAWLCARWTWSGDRNTSLKYRLLQQ